jgi:hypothetical protein
MSYMAYNMLYYNDIKKLKKIKKFSFFFKFLG